MFSHMMLGSNDLDRSKRFYDALFTAVGAKPGVTDPKDRLVYVHDGGRLLITRPIDGEAATCGNGSTVGFLMDSPEQADAWHAAGAGPWRNRDRRAARRAPEPLRADLPRLPARPRRQQALRPAPT